jgi:hypothetical protein
MFDLMKALSFTARIYKVGINPCVDAPSEAGKIFQRRGFIPVAGSVNRESYRATLVPQGGACIVFISTEKSEKPRELMSVAWSGFS